MNIGYFSVQHSSHSDFIRWELLEEQPLISKTNYFNHVRFEKPLTILMDGLRRTSTILTEENDD